MRQPKKKRRLIALITNEVAETTVTDNRVFHRFVVDHASARMIRNDTMGGDAYTVVPMVMMVEGVHNGSNGPLLYNAAELGRLPATWNHKPVSVYHPDGESACTPEEVTARAVGVIMNAKFDDKNRLIAEAWIKEDRCKKVDKRVWDAVQKKKTMECSIGSFVEVENEEGEWEGEKYVGIARNLSGDHLAILPDQTGACSVKDGAGFVRNELRANFGTLDDEDTELIRAQIIKNLQSIKKKSPAIAALLENEQSYEQIREQLCAEVCRLYPSSDGYAYPWIEAVYDDYFVFHIGGALLKVGYSTNGTTVQISGEPQKVVRVTEYKTVSGGLTTNAKPPTAKTDKEKAMNKNQLVADLIKNHGYTEKDRDTLMGLDEKTLARMQHASQTAVANAAKKKPAPVIVENEDDDSDDESEDAETEDEDAAPAPVRRTVNKEKAAVKPAAPALNKNQLAALRYGEKMLAKNRAILTAKIIAAKNNKFTEEQLAAMEIETLESIASLAAPVKVSRNQEADPDDDDDGDEENDYSAQAAVPTNVRNTGERVYKESDALVMEPLILAPAAKTK